MTEEIAVRSCGHCGAVVPEEDRFCEECGTAVAQEGVENPCPKCGSGADQMDAEGFCSACGFRREERGRDHLELVVSPLFAGVSDRGLRHHRNEDFLSIATIDSINAPQTSLLIVCDGVSSSRDPDVASAVATERLRTAFEQSLQQNPEFTEAAMQSALNAAQDAVAAIPTSASVTSDYPATTAVAAVVQESHAIIGWMGDSRAYWIDDGGALPLTADHSWVNDIVSAGTMSAQVANRSPYAHAITRWLGARTSGEAIEPATLRFVMPGQGMLLLCSDGLWNYDPEPSDLLCLLKSLQGDGLQITRGLIDFARSKGGNDNITAVVFMSEPLVAAESKPESDQ